MYVVYVLYICVCMCCTCDVCVLYVCGHVLWSDEAVWVRVSGDV